MIVIGSCSDHVFRSWFKADYISLTNNTKFQFSYCVTRSIVEKFLADRLYEIWSILRKLYWASPLKYKQLKWKNTNLKNQSLFTSTKVLRKWDRDRDRENRENTKSMYSFRISENKDQKYSEYVHFIRSEGFILLFNDWM